MKLFGSRRGSSGAATIMMVVAFLGIAGFVFWLRGAAAPTEVVVVEEEPVDDGTPRVSYEAFAADPVSHAGQTIRITDVPVTSAFGSNGFWTEDASKQPLLVHVPGTVTIPSTGTATIVGAVMSMSDSVLTEWETAGHITGAGDRAAAEFSEAFVEAESVEFTTGG